jgi:hypothetical protein
MMECVAFDFKVLCDFWPEHEGLWHQRQVGQHQRSWNNYCLGTESEADESCFTTSYKQNQDEDLGLLWCDTVFWVEWCQMLQRNITSVLLGLLDNWRCRYCVCLEIWKPHAQWSCVTSKKTCIVSIITVRFEYLTANILAKVILCTWKSGWDYEEFTHKKSQVF